MSIESVMTSSHLILCRPLLLLHYEDLQDLLEVTPKKDVLFIIGDWKAKVGSQETPGVSGKFGLGVRNEAGQRLIEFCQENALVIASSNNTDLNYTDPLICRSIFISKYYSTT